MFYVYKVLIEKKKKKQKQKKKKNKKKKQTIKTQMTSQNVALGYRYRIVAYISIYSNEGFLFVCLLLFFFSDEKMSHLTFSCYSFAMG